MVACRVPGYDHAAEMARLGHASLLLDRLGYAASDHPPGFETCIGSEADVVHQLVGQLRAGSYEVETGEAVAFSRIALVGHSSGAVVAEAAAYSFGELDGLVVIGSPVIVNVLPLVPIGPYTLEVCAGGGESPAEAPGVRGYVRKWQRFEDEAQAAFPDADPAVYAALAPLVHHDPCAEEMTVIPALFVRDAFAWRVTAPVMAIFGERDAFAPPPNADLLAALYVGAADVTVLTVPGVGHSPQLAPSAPELREALHRWLQERAL